MGSGYYRVEQHFPPGGRWYLGAVCDDHGREIDISVFLQTAPLDLGPPVCLPLVGSGTTVLGYDREIGGRRLVINEPGAASSPSTSRTGRSSRW